MGRCYILFFGEIVVKTQILDFFAFRIILELSLQNPEKSLKLKNQRMLLTPYNFRHVGVENGRIFLRFWNFYFILNFGRGLTIPNMHK